MFCARFFTVLVSFSMIAPAAAVAQQQPDQVPPPWEISPQPRIQPPLEIHVDRDCAFLTYPADAPPGAKPKKDHFPDLCHLEAVLDSRHKEDAMEGAEVREVNVEIREQEYVLQNASTAPVVFVIEHLVPRDWKVDSDPQPAAYEGDRAIFRAHAEPGEIVRLHVGIRRESHLRMKRLKTLPPALGGISRN